MASLPAANPLANVLRKVLPKRLSGPLVRWIFALGTLASFTLFRRWPKVVKASLRRDLTRRLPDGYDVDTHFTPPYDPWDQRLCVVPDGDLFTAIRRGEVSVVTDHIESFTETGITLRSGETLEADIVVTATGLELLFAGGMTLRVDGEDVNLPDKLTYKGMMLEDVPNLALAIGYTNASWTLKCELTCQYVPGAQPPAHRRAAAGDAAQPRFDDLAGAPVGSDLRLHHPGVRSIPPTGHPVPLAGTRTICVTIAR
ncbi:MAG: NAD(P)/FAD-dependent oxidoreductase [Microthrixaceae bacterium]